MSRANPPSTHEDVRALRHLFLAFAAALSVAGCSDDSDPSGGADAGLGRDAGSAIDAGPRDGGPVDGGQGIDARVSGDAGPDDDAGEALDAGAPFDAGDVDAGPSPLGALVINEISPHNTPGDYIELYNPGSEPISLDGYRIADLDTSTGGPKLSEAAHFPDDTSIAGSSYLVLAKDDTTCVSGMAPGCASFPFGLSTSGDTVFIINAANEVLLRADLPAISDPTKSHSRLPNGTGGFAEGALTPGAANAPHE